MKVNNYTVMSLSGLPCVRCEWSIVGLQPAMATRIFSINTTLALCHFNIFFQYFQNFKQQHINEFKIIMFLSHQLPHIKVNRDYKEHTHIRH